MSAALQARPALFIDRDGTIIADAHYPSLASQVRLIPGAAAAIAHANSTGVLVIVVTNQSGIARGMITLAQYESVRDRMNALLAAAGARVDATFHCPHWPDVDGACDCRKPGLGLYRDASAQFDIDLTRSAYIGDRWRDVQPAVATGGFGVLVPGVETSESDVEKARTHVSERLRIAASLGDCFLANLGGKSACSPSVRSIATL